jgi:prephenate dehydratase
MESSVEGAVPVTQDELTHGEPLLITAEAYVPVTFDLLVRPGTDRSAIRTVGAHPHGHAQIRGWLAAELPAAEAVMTASNAAAAAAVAAGELDAAAAAPVAGSRYGLQTLVADVGEVRDAVTRFVLLRRPGRPPAPTGNDRTSLVLSVGNHPGSLLTVLGEFASRGINLTRLESRPTRSRMGVYYFLVDADGHLNDPAMADVVAALIRRQALLRWLGSYPRAAGVNEVTADFATPDAYRQADDQVRRWQRGG